MTKEQFIEALANEAGVILNTIKAKGNSYNGQSNPNPFYTYEGAARDSHVETTQAIHTRLCEKYYRLSALMGGGKDEVNEDVHETLRDLVAQALILSVRISFESLPTVEDFITPPLADSREEYLRQNALSPEAPVLSHKGDTVTSLKKSFSSLFGK